MIEYLRQCDEEPGHAGRFRAGVTTRLQALPSWKGAADFPFVRSSHTAWLAAPHVVPVSDQDSWSLVPTRS